MNKIKIDLRSDTITRPGKEMLNAMMNAPVGDDVMREDPTVNKLEAMAAEMFGMESSLFCPSGTMTNQIAIKVHTRPGDEVICDKTAHIYNYEGGGIAMNSGASVRLINGINGQFSTNEVLDCINPDDVHQPATKLVSIENTSNKGGGSIWDLEDIRSIRQLCDEKNLALHMDGARLFNAIVEQGSKPEDFGKSFDSISICLSKGLGTPIGSLLLGEKDFIYHARRMQKALGGGMRQAGYIAAAGIYALENNINRLREDHFKAEELETVIDELDWVEQVLPVQTNIVIFEVKPEIDVNLVISKLAEQNILISGFGGKLLRIVTHLDYNDEMQKEVIKVLKSLDI
jgi:threonine aldolase